MSIADLVVDIVLVLGCLIIGGIVLGGIFCLVDYLVKKAKRRSK